MKFSYKKKINLIMEFKEILRKISFPKRYKKNELYNMLLL